MPALQRVPPPPLVQSARLPEGQHDMPTHASVSLLSTTPSQSSSSPLQVSTRGPTAPEQLPYIDPPAHGLPAEIAGTSTGQHMLGDVPQAAALHCCTPEWQMPTPGV